MGECLRAAYDELYDKQQKSKPTLWTRIKNTCRKIWHVILGVF